MHKSVDIDLLEFSKLRPKSALDQPSAAEVEVLRASGRSIQPIVARTLLGSSPSRYEIILGERWWLAAQQAGLHRIEIEIRDDLSNDEVLALLRDANKGRGEGSSLDRARRCAELLATGRTQEDVAAAMNLSRTQVAHLVRLLKLAPEVQALLGTGTLKTGPARALVGLPVARQRYFAREFVGGRMSTREIERAAAAEKRGGRSLARQDTKTASLASVSSANRRSIILRQAPHPDPDIARVEGQMGESTGLVTEIQWDPDARRGAAIFSFSSLEEFEGLVARLGIGQEEFQD